MNILRPYVEDPDELRNAAAYGTGAIIAIESSATGGGVGFSEIATVAILAGQKDYIYYDTTAPTGRWYRTRYSNSGRTNQSGYTAEKQAPTASILTVAQFREHIATDLVDDAVQRLLDANTQAIVRRFGPTDTVTMTRYPRQNTILFFDRPIQAITSITEFFPDPVGISGVAVDPTDYRLRDGGTTLERWGYGTHPADWWSSRVDIVYVPVDDSAERVRVLIKLCELDLNRHPGISQVRIGEYSEQSRNEPYDDEREAILASLTPSGMVFA